MSMGVQVRFISYLILVSGQGGDDPFLLKQFQSIIHRCLGESGDFLFQLGIDHLGGWVYPVLSQVLHNLYPLVRSEEHTSELQSRPHLVCRLLLEKKKKTSDNTE